MQRKKNKSESYTEYLARLKSLAADCKFGDMLAKVLRDKFVLEAGPVLDKLLQQDEDSLTVAKALQLAQKTMMASTGFGIQEGPAAVEVKTEPGDLHHINSWRGGSTQHRRSAGTTAGRGRASGHSTGRVRSAVCGRSGQGREYTKQGKTQGMSGTNVRCGERHRGMFL